jgi:hypothetical protein
MMGMLLTIPMGRTGFDVCIPLSDDHTTTTCRTKQKSDAIGSFCILMYT